jgi:hypothetical protein
MPYGYHGKSCTSDQQPTLGSCRRRFYRTYLALGHGPDLPPQSHARRRRPGLQNVPTCSPAR